MTNINSLRELAGDVAPPRDLWPEINARLAKESGMPFDAGGADARRGIARKQILALAAAVSAVAIGLGLALNFSGIGGGNVPHSARTTDLTRVLQVANVTDPRYLKERAALISSLDQRLKTLPPETQTQVAKSLATIRESMSDIQAALGREPGNALLQELLVNNYQDEMRVLAAVHEAGNSGEEI
jgi:hypothetical protein